MSKVFSYVFVIVVLICSSTTWAQDTPKTNTNPEQEETIKIETNLVNVTILATNKDGQYIKDLKQEDFLVYENGKPQQIELFASESTPINVVLLIDLSTSTMYHSQAIKRAAKAFIENTRPNDKVKLISFTYNINELNNFTDNKEALNRAVDKIKVGGSTRLYDSVEYSARVIFSKIEGRKVLIILTDGIDSSSYFQPQFAIDKVVETNTVVYVVKYPIEPQAQPSYLFSGFNKPKPQNKPLDFLKELVEQTGGDIVAAPSFNSLAEKMRNISEQLQHTYSLGYYPSNPISNGGYRKIEVKLRNRKASLHHKKGYDARKIASKPAQEPSNNTPTNQK